MPTTAPASVATVADPVAPTDPTPRTAPRAARVARVGAVVALTAVVAVAAGISRSDRVRTTDRPRVSGAVTAGAPAGRPPVAHRADAPGPAHGSLATAPDDSSTPDAPATPAEADDDVVDITGQQSELTSEEPPPVADPGLPELVGTVFDA